MNTGEKKKSRVAVATGDSREEAVRRALALVRDDIAAKVHGKVIVKPNFLSSVHRICSTQADAVRPVLELLRGLDTDSVTVAEGGSRSTRQALDRFGYRELAGEFDIGFADMNHGGFSRSFELLTESRGSHFIEYSDIAAEADTVVSVAVAKTHDTAAVTLSLKNMMGCLRRVRRPRMHGIQIGPAAERFGEMLWDTIEDHSWAIKIISGAVFRIIRLARAFDRKKTHGASPGLLSQVGAMSENLARLGTVLMPDVAVIDAFTAMEGDGPGSSGTPVDMRIAVAGTDPIACDTIMVSMMGFDPRDIGYLVLAGERGLGISDPENIEIVGEDPELHTRRFKPHTNFQVQKRWREAWNE